MLSRLIGPISLVCHQNADFDAIASLYLLEAWLKQITQTNISLHCSTGLSLGIPQLGVSPILQSQPSHPNIITLDCRTMQRTGYQLPEVAINFDHHPNNSQFAKLNIIDLQAVSTTELLWKLIPQQFKTPSICQLALLGIFSDSQNLSTPNLSSQTLRTCSEILKISNQLQASLNILKPKLKAQELKQLGELLLQSQINSKQIASIYLTQHYPKAIRNLALQQLSQLQNTKAVCLIQNDKGRIQGSLRSKKIDVHKLSELFQGGGHKNAAGFEIKI